MNVKEILASFFCHNFYQNIISPFSVEENLLYIICIMLKEEIHKLNSIEQLNDFLNKTPCGYLLGELRNKSDVQAFAKNIMKNIIDKLLDTCSEKKINLNITNIINNIVKMEKDLKKKNKYIENLEDLIFLKNIEYSLCTNDEDTNYFNSFKIKNQKQINLFNEKYVSNLDKKELKKFADIYKNDQNMKDFIAYKLFECSNDNNYFSNENLIDKIFEFKYSKILFTLYQIDFLKIIELLDLLVDSFIKSLQLLPYSIKCICKFISIFIKKKFPKIKKYEENAFICQFLFVNLFIPILKNPIKSYIIDCIISKYILYNLRLIVEVFIQLNLGKFYNNKDEHFNFTPFNWYFIEKMPKIFDFYENVTKVEFPIFIEKLVNDQLPEDYKYDFFNENPDEIISHRSICFTLTDINCLLVNMNKCKNILFPENIKNDSKLYKMFGKLNSEFYKNLIDNINKKINLQSLKNDNPIQNTVLFCDLLINPKYEHLFNVTSKKEYFYIKELNKIENEEDSIKNNIIKVKNYLSGLLYNCRKLNKLDFYLKTNTIEILKEIKILLKTNEFVIDNTIPYEWYVNSLLDCLKKIPKELAENDYEKLYNELETDLNKSIEVADFYMMSDCFGKIKYCKKSIEYYKQLKKCITDIDLNEKLNEIIENKKIPIEMKFIFTDKQKLFSIYAPSVGEKQMSELFMGEVNKNCRICLNIDEFIKYFPNLVKIQLLKGINILKEIENMKMIKNINDYLTSISKILKKEKTFNQDEYVIIQEKIFDFILTKLYDKLYPAYPSNDDLLILKSCLELSWIEPKHLIENAKNNNYDIFMDDIKQFFTEFEKEKSPRKKFKIIMEIFQTISKIISFNGEDGGNGADDNIAILMYIFTKVQPKNICSDIEYMKLFIKDKNGTEDNQITHLITVCEGLKNMNHSRLFNVTEEEYNNNCKIALEKINKRVDK